MKTKTASSKKTTASAEREAREARAAKKSAPRKSKAAREALAGVAALHRNAEAAERGPLDPQNERDAEILKAREMGIELGPDEFLTKPESVADGHLVKRIVRRNGKPLAQPIFKVAAPQPAAAQASSSTGARRKKTPKPDSARAGWDKVSIAGDRAQQVLQKLQQGTRERPVMAARQLSDQERHIARGLFAQGKIKRDKFEQGLGYFA